ncbi:hypothetical protein TNCV_1853701 [Trichonephila clavipes]|nr:hypothetical protein TNCV_1853701 [Trichonephila clavipes]
MILYITRQPLTPGCTPIPPTNRIQPEDKGAVRGHPRNSCELPPGSAKAYPFLHRSINRQVANMVSKNDDNMVSKNDDNLAQSPTFRYVSI